MVSNQQPKEKTQRKIGRPKAEPSKTIRVPMALVEAVESMIKAYRLNRKKT